MKILVAILILLITLSACSKPDVTIYLTRQKISPVDNLLFGHFLEKASWGGEIGGDVLIDTTNGEFYSQAIKYLKSMNIPIIRFPGGTDVDYYPWYYLIDRAPGTNGRRKPNCNFSGNKSIVSDNRLGLDEFLKLCDTLKAQPLLVVNMGDAFLQNLSIKEAAANATAFVAYCNLNQSSDPKLIPWIETRKLNGRTKAYGVKYWEIGNEPWLWKGLSMETESDSLIDLYFNCLETIIDAMLDVDSTIVILTDGGIKNITKTMKQRMGDKIDMLTYHPYQPWAIKNVIRDKDTISASLLTNEDVWKAWVSVPACDTVFGMSTFVEDAYYQNAVSGGYHVCLTEWNWNGWWQLENNSIDPLDSKFAKSVGATGYLHAMMRSGNYVKMGCQSMLAGQTWGITAIRVDQKGIRHFPTSKVTGLYSRYHGDSLLKIEHSLIPVYNQSFKMGSIEPSLKVATLDVVASSSDSVAYLHFINREFNKPILVNINLSKYLNLETAVLHTFIQSEDDLGKTLDIPQNIKYGKCIVNIPAASVSILELRN